MKGDITGTCAICGSDTASDGLGTGYGIDSDTGDKVCYACCGVRDSEYMRTHDKIVLYLSRPKGSDYWQVSNWPGSLRFVAFVNVHKRGHFSPFAGHMERRDAWFLDEHGNAWHARSIGAWSEIAHCQKLKSERAIREAKGIFCYNGSPPYTANVYS